MGGKGREVQGGTGKLTEGRQTSAGRGTSLHCLRRFDSPEFIFIVASGDSSLSFDY